ncbi:MAG: Maf family nucleotide pyrophosphatase [Emcibacter sp.]|nr:Maf family nucleotide pyrophosphatase [Emcibacter sp.]
MADPTKPNLILASASKSRRVMLRNAGISCRFEAANIDEAVVKNSMMKVGAAPEKISEKLAQEKAVFVSKNHPNDIILGADQLLFCEGRLFDKPKDKAEAKAHLQFFRGKSHILHTSYALVRQNALLICETYSPCLTMRNFSDDFLDKYLDQSGDKILNSVGCYLLEDRGPQLFSEINGDYFTILGLPLLNVMENLRKLNILDI